jgi:hypothetical protein
MHETVTFPKCFQLILKRILILSKHFDLSKKVEETAVGRNSKEFVARIIKIIVQRNALSKLFFHVNPSGV